MLSNLSATKEHCNKRHIFFFGKKSTTKEHKNLQVVKLTIYCCTQGLQNSQHERTRVLKDKFPLYRAPSLVHLSNLCNKLVHQKGDKIHWYIWH